MQRVRRMGTRASPAAPGLVLIRRCTRGFLNTYPFHPRRPVGFREEMAVATPLPADPRCTSPFGALGQQGLPGRIQGRTQGLLIGLGTAPLDDPLFRAAVFEQLGESRLEGPSPRTLPDAQTLTRYGSMQRPSMRSRQPVCIARLPQRSFSNPMADRKG